MQRATGSPYSHMGMVFMRNGQPHVLEAVQTVRYTPLARWIARGLDGNVVVKRLRNTDQPLTAEALQPLRAEAEQFMGQPYDLYFGWGDERIYCSELVWKAYQCSLGIKIGALEQVQDFDLSSPAVKAKMRERYGDDIPLQEPVISPVAMFESEQLISVLSDKSAAA